jgi:sulfoxide reductase heme-binding subunit YedZ
LFGSLGTANGLAERRTWIGADMDDGATGRAKSPIWLRWAETPVRAMVCVAIVATLLITSALAAMGTGQDGWGAATRYTVQLAYPFFLLSFIASSLVRLFPSAASRALLKRRRAIGLAFAVAMAFHGVCILVLARIGAIVFTLDVAAIFGGFAYVVIAAMAVTSNDTAARRLGRQRWQALHRTGQMILVIPFLATYGGHFAEDPTAWSGLALLLGALGLRIAAALQSVRFRRTTLPTE